MGSRSAEIIKRIDTNRPVIGAEIGVRYGKNAEQILTAAPNLTLYCIDRWAKPPAGDTYYKSEDGIAQRPAGHLKKCYAQAVDRLSKFKNRVVIMQKSSLAAVDLFADKFFDFVFIDADHSYDGVKKDIINWLPKIKPGGWIGGHDYHHPKITGVTLVVDEVFDDFETGTDYTWFREVA